jgi:hypothetical protein
MPTVEERITAVEGKIDAIADLKAMLGEWRVDMNRQFSEVRTDMDRRFSEVNRRVETLDQRMERHFNGWWAFSFLY